MAQDESTSAPVSRASGATTGKHPKSGAGAAASESGRARSGSYPAFPEFQPDREKRDGRYILRFARDLTDLDRILELRFDVFNLELNEGLQESYANRRDRDVFDEQCNHLLVEHTATGAVVGTYRLQTHEIAQQTRGFYSSNEFDISQLPAEVLRDSVEIGRACISRPHRNRQVLFMLWKGLASYAKWNDKRYFFGCCSLTSQDPAEGVRTLAWLRSHGYMHPQFVAPPLPGFECVDPGSGSRDLPEVEIPKLFGTYLRYGAKICGPPAIDREFGTIDFLALLDIKAMNPKVLSTIIN